MPQQVDFALQATAIDEEIRQDIHREVADSTVVDLSDEPLFAEVPAVAASADRPSLMPSMKSVHVAVPTPTQAIVEAMVTKPVATRGQVPGWQRRVAASQSAWGCRRRQKPLQRWHGDAWYSRFGEKIAMAHIEDSSRRCCRRCLDACDGSVDVPQRSGAGKMGSTAEDVHQAAPFTDNRIKPATPSSSSLGDAAPAVAERVKPIIGDCSPTAARDDTDSSPKKGEDDSRSGPR